MYFNKRNLHYEENHVHFQNINSTEISSGQALLTKKINVRNIILLYKYKKITSLGKPR